VNDFLKKNMVKLEDILSAVSEASGISVDAIKAGGGARGKRQVREVTTARQIYCFVAREVTGCSLCEIGEAINRDHSTVLYSVVTIRGYVDIGDRRIKGIVKLVYSILNKN
jgi:chromosomal replication initiation ATPase DnaA